MIAAILCGGKGERLRSTIGEHQKCAVDVGGRPWIHRVLDELHAGGIREILLLTGYKSEEINVAADAWFSEKVKGKAGVRLTTLHTTPAGPVEAIDSAFARAGVNRLLVVNGDTLVDGFPLADFVGTCERLGKTCVVRGKGALGEPVADSGLTFIAIGTPVSAWPTDRLFLDIGSPKGLAEARRRFSS